MPATTAETLSLVTKTVTVAPLVLLSVADHYGRTAKGTKKRVVGVLLGENTGQTVRVSNSFAGASCSHASPPKLSVTDEVVIHKQFHSKKMKKIRRFGS